MKCGASSRSHWRTRGRRKKGYGVFQRSGPHHNSCVASRRYALFRRIDSRVLMGLGDLVGPEQYGKGKENGE